MTQNTDAPRQLSPWNPLDHLRLLWWILVAPQRLVMYREAYGEDDEYRVGKWLISVLAWLPLFVLIVALEIGTIPCVITDLPITYCGLGASMALTWALVNYFKSKSCGTSILAFIAT